MKGLTNLKDDGASELVVIPMFLSGHHPLYKLAEERLTDSNLTDLPVEFTETMSQSYLTAEILADRISDLSVNSADESLVLVATGASNQDEMEGIRSDVNKLLHMNHGRFGLTANQ